MTKKLLLAASALGVLAFAGGASAGEITAAELSGLAVYDSADATPSTPYPVAAETISSNATRTTTGVVGDNTVSFSLEDGLQPGATYSFTTTLSNAVLTTALANSAFSISGLPAACALSITRSGSNGTANSSAATYTVVVPTTAADADCTEAAVGVDAVATLDFTQLRAAAIAPVSVTVTGGLSPSNTLVGADARADISQSITLATVVSGYEARVDARVGNGAGTNTFLSLTPEPVYSTLGGDGILGEVGFAAADLDGYAAPTAFVGFGSTALPAVESEIVLTISGTDFETLVPTGFTVDEDDATVATLTGDDFVSVVVDEAAGIETSIASGNISVQATVTPTEATGQAAAAVTLPEAFSASLETIELQGTSFVAPWVQSSNPNYNTVIRLSNAGSRATGQVQLALSSPLRAPTATTCTVDGVPANGELAINSAQLTSCFGDFGRGDVTITVLSLGDDLTAKLRIVNPGNIVAEQSLGRTSGVDQIADASN